MKPNVEQRDQLFRAFARALFRRDIDGLAGMIYDAGQAPWPARLPVAAI